MHKNIALRILYILTTTFYTLFFLISCSSSVKLTDALKTNTQDIERIRSMSHLDHTVVLAPIVIALEPTTQQGNNAVTGEKVLNIDPDHFSKQLLQIFQTNNVFKSIEKLSTSPPKADLPQAQGSKKKTATDNTNKKLQIREARAKKATLLMNVSVKKARLYCIGKNDAVLGNSAMWLCLGVPSLWGADIDYGIEIIASVSFLDVASSPDFATPIYSYEYPFKVEGGLNYLERSSSIAIVVMPPQFCPDNLDKIETLILSNAQEQLLIKLAEQTKKEFGK
ncbi:MAG: hypothetical protein V1709_09300 [Planctomycetota bacterium]